MGFVLYAIVVREIPFGFIEFLIFCSNILVAGWQENYALKCGQTINTALRFVEATHRMHAHMNANYVELINLNMNTSPVQHSPPQ